MLDELALFLGAGGGVLGTRTISRVVCGVEIDSYCREVILRRQEEGILEPFPVWDDVRTFDGRPWRDVVDLVTAGFPCQPFSVAGAQRGASDPRNLWPDTARVLGEVRPRFALLENVPGLASSGYLSVVLADLAALGFSVRWGCLSAAAVGSNHIRERLWVVAMDADADAIGRDERWARHARNAGTGDVRAPVADAERAELRHESGRGSGSRGQGAAVARDDGAEGIVADADAGRREVERIAQPARIERARGRLSHGCGSVRQLEHSARGVDWWLTEPDVGRVADGVAHRVDRLSAIGNGQVPAVVRRVWELMTEEVGD